MRIVLADLRHNQVTDIYPRGVANLATYADAHVKSAEPREFTIVRELQDLEHIPDSEPPDILGLSSYAWKHERAYHLADDVERWRSTGYPYKFSDVEEYSTSISEDMQAKITSCMHAYGQHPPGLGKFTRTMSTNDLRRTVVGQPASQLQEVRVVV